jgi:biopolymer transport protein ExbD
MPGACTNYWQEYGCEWNVQYLWHWTNRFARLDMLALALLLAYIFAVAIHASRRYYLSRRALRIHCDSRGLRKLATGLRLEVGHLRSVAYIAPYLGLLGTCLGLLSLFNGFAMESHAARVMLASKAAAALLTTAAGILVAVPATCFYNYLRTRIDLLDRESPNEPPAQRSRLLLKKSFSGLSTFALMAASSLAILAVACMPFLRTKYPTGLGIELVATRCEYVQNDRATLLHVTNAGRLFINDEEEDRRNLAHRLSEIYSVREQRTLDLLADGGLSFQNVADVIDMVAGAESNMKTGPLNIDVRLITPAAINSGCVAIPLRDVPIRSARRTWP